MHVSFKFRKILIACKRKNVYIYIYIYIYLYIYLYVYYPCILFHSIKVL